jgi:DNA-3-methyladenine glycosylase
VTDAHPPLARPLRDPPPVRWLRQTLPRTFFSRSSVELAQRLLGTVVVRDASDGLAAGMIVETEAYDGPRDRASHARAGCTRRTAPMFGPGGHAYVYLVYGMHSCLNVVSGPTGEAGAVLVRAIEPLLGVELMRSRRGNPAAVDSRLGAGPAMLCQALGITRALNGLDLTVGRELWLAPASSEETSAIAPGDVVVGPRVGVAYAGPDWASRPWRFGIRDHPSLSRRFPAAPSEF